MILKPLVSHMSFESVWYQRDRSAKCLAEQHQVKHLPDQLLGGFLAAPELLVDSCSDATVDMSE